MLTRERYIVLRAMADDATYDLWPMMRRAFLREHLIEPNGDQPEPSDKRRRKAPKRPYLVTRRGRKALKEYELEFGIVRGRPRVLPMKTQLSLGRGGVSSEP